MQEMADDLAARGYHTVNIGYPSRTKPIEELVEGVARKIPKSCKSAPKMNFVGHSMGGLITRAYIEKYKPRNLGRVVMLGTPNHGSEVADFLKNVGLYKTFFGPAGQELVTDQSAFGAMFGKVDYELGVIAGDRSADPVSSYIIPGTDDGRVSVASTKLKGMKDHIVLHVMHMAMPKYDIVISQTAYFLKHGVFKRSK
jgi:triacylglycerol esterase/lipase EstA (alpha/beta hydrolase family)